MKIPVVRVQALLRGVDTTNIYPDGTVKYHMSGVSDTSSADDFIRDAEAAISREQYPWHVRTLSSGTRVSITKADAGDTEVGLELRDISDSKHKIRFKFKERKWGYTAEDVRRLLDVCFATSQEEATQEPPTPTIQLGMSVEDVIGIKGKPKTRVELGAKTILTYDDLKLFFRDGKLVDVQ